MLITYCFPPVQSESFYYYYFQGYKLSHSVQTGMIELMMERFTKESEGTYTIQIEDGKAKNQSSLLLIGDGKRMIVPY